MNPIRSLSRGSNAAVVMLLILAACSCEPTVAQQTNVMTPTPCSLSVNGTGAVDATNAIILNNAMVSPTPPGSAPLFHHRGAAKVHLQFRVEGPVGAPVVLVYSPFISSSPVQFPPGGQLEVSLFGIQTIVNGLDPTQWQNLGAFVNGQGDWTFTLPSGLPPGIGLSHVQAALFDPAYSGGFRLTASVTVEIRNDIETLMRNALDAIPLAPRNASYFPGTLSAGFLDGGEDAPGAVAEFAGGEVISTTYLGISPNATNLPALPTGAPTSAQDVAFALDSHFQLTPGCGVPSARGNTARDYDFHVIEESGVWKFHGNQQEAWVAAALDFQSGPVQGLSVWLDVEVEEDYGAHGGISNVTVTGPQLGSINTSGQSTTSASGTQSLNQQWTGNYGESYWDLMVELGAAGTSRMPWIELPAPTGPRDVYAITIFWNDTTTSGPYAVPLRAALDPQWWLPCPPTRPCPPRRSPSRTPPPPPSPSRSTWERPCPRAP